MLLLRYYDLQFYFYFDKLQQGTDHHRWLDTIAE